MRLRLAVLFLVAASLACSAVLPATPSPAPTRAPTRPPATTVATATQPPTPTLAPATGTPEPGTPLPPPRGVRACDFDPLLSEVAQMPPGLLAAPTATVPAAPELPPNTTVPAATTELHLRVFHKLADTIASVYIDPDLSGLDWPAVVAGYEALIAKGLTDDDFYLALNDLIAELGDEHSYLESPAEVAESNAAFAGEQNYVGIGVLIQPVPDAGRGVIIQILPGGPAAEAGLRPHDSILAVDGEPLLEADGSVRSVLRGPEGTPVTITVQRPGEAPQELALVRRRITGPLPIGVCLIPRTRVAYIFLPSLEDETIPGQVRSALRDLTAEGPLDGVVLDNRENSGGLSTVLEAVLGLFTSGRQGHFVSREQTRPLEIEAEDIGGSQDVPLVVLVGEGTASYGEVLSGVLQTSGRAQVIGQTTAGNVETLWPYNFEDGSRAWIAQEAFQPVGGEAGAWEIMGIVPDVEVPVRWDLFTEANDPALPVALDLLDAPVAGAPASLGAGRPLEI